MVRNGNSGNGNHGQWTTTLNTPDNPYLARIDNGAGEDRADGQSRTEAKEVEGAELPPIETGRGRKRRGRLLFFCVAALGVICAALGLYAWYGGRARVSYQIAEKKTVRPAQLTEQSRPGAESEPVNQVTSDAINQAKEEFRKAGVAAEPVVTAVASGVTTGGDRQASPGPVFTPYIVPEATIVTDGRSATAPDKVAGQTGGDSAGGLGRAGRGGSATGQPYYRGPEAMARSIYVVTPERKTSNTPTPPRSPRVESGSATPALALTSVKLPPFGTLLPVRTLGVFYTFRNASLARLELTRDVYGDGWSLPRGTKLIAQNQGSVNDRAFLSLTGFIDPETNRFVRLAGDVLGGDGGPGLKGKKKKIGGALGSVLNRVANGALALGQAALSRGGTTVVVPGGSLVGYGNDFGLSQSAVSRREFVEVPAGAPAYVMVTDLPKEVRGVDADPTVQDGGALTEEELADLLSKGTPEQVKEALPRMPPDMRKVAELTLNAR